MLRDRLEALKGLAPYRQNQAAPSMGAAQAHWFRFADESMIRIDIPQFDPEREFDDANRPHMAIYPPHDAHTHLSVDGVVVLPTASTAHVFLR